MPPKQGLNLTINTTEDCNMRCKYCYEINKHNKSIEFDKCKKFIDLVVSDDDYLDLNTHKDEIIENIRKSGVILDFIGGDALMNVDILDQVLTYLVFKLNTSKTEIAKYWRSSWKASISSNGTLFSSPKVRAFCEKWKYNLSLGVSIDGCPEIHDKNRIMLERGPNGEEIGSINKILEWWPWYRETFPLDSLQTKATCAKDSIPYLYDSLVFMHEKLGLKYINQNFIMEDTGCTEEDYKILEDQLDKCVKYVFDHRHELYWSMIDKNFLCKAREDSKDYWSAGRCGSGSMPALSIDGQIYPCFRWLPHTQKSSGIMSVGNVNDGFIHKENFSKVRLGSARCNCTKDPKCLDCEYEEACSYCIGGCYAEFNDFIRTTYICEITKKQSAAARKYWSMIENLNE